MDEIEFGADKHDGQIRFSIILQLLDPFRNVLKALVICYVIDDESTLCSSEMSNE